MPKSGNCTALGLGRSAEWRQVLELFPAADAYYLPEYHRAHELNGDGQALALVVKDGGEVFLHPFFLRSIEDGYHDLQTVKGFTGPLSTTFDPAFLAAAWDSFAQWGRQEGVVAEFVRCNPALETHRILPPEYEVEIDRDLVWIDLRGSLEKIWAGYPSVQRNMVRKAIRRGLTCQAETSSAAWQAFRRLHRATMERNQVDEYLYFSEAYFDHLERHLPEHALLFVVRQGSGIVATGLFLVYGDQIHYQFGNRDPDCDGAATNLLLHTVVEWAVGRGYRRFDLGGGRTGDPRDLLLRFKLSLSPLRVPYRVARRIHNREVYDRLCSRWMTERQLDTLPAHTFPYRLPQVLNRLQGDPGRG